MIQVDFSSIEGETGELSERTDKPVKLTELIYLTIKENEIPDDKYNPLSESSEDEYDRPPYIIDSKLLMDLNMVLVQSGVIHQFKRVREANRVKREMFFAEHRDD